MGFNLKKLKQIDSIHKKCVFEFIRDQEAQNVLTSLNIPMVVYYICLAYYLSAPKEYFENCEHNMSISKDSCVTLLVNVC